MEPAGISTNFARDVNSSIQRDFRVRFSFIMDEIRTGSETSFRLWTMEKIRRVKRPAILVWPFQARPRSILIKGLTISLIVAAILTAFTGSEAQELLALTRADRFAVPHSGIEDPDEFESFTD